MPRPASLLCAFSPAIAEEFFPDELQTALSRAAPVVHHLDPTGMTAETFAQELKAHRPEVLLTAWGTPPLPEYLPLGLRYVCHLCGTVRGLVTRRHLENGLIVTNWGGSISRTVAECALFHMLAGLRRATAWTFDMHQRGAWNDAHTRTYSLFERKVGLHGFGAVARELVKLLTPFHASIRVHAPDVTAANAAGLGVEVAPTLEALLEDNDVVIELAPLNAATRGSITEDLLRRLRPGGVFVNVGRGPVVDEEALVRVARQGRIQIGLDVYATEPLPPDSPLRGLSNVSLTPHTAGPTNDRRRDAGAHALANLRAYATDQPLQAVISAASFDLIT